MSITTVAAEEIPDDLLGAGYIRRTPMLHTTWQSFRNEVPEGLRPHLADCCFVLLKPDVLASWKQEKFWNQLLAVGAQPVVAWACLTSGLREFEELYKFNLTLNNDQCMLSSWWLHNRPYQMGPVICLLVRVPKEVRGAMAAADYIAARKGPSNPFLATRGQWRHDLVSTNMALNLVHTSDDPISSVREFRIFGSAQLLRRALARCRELVSGAPADQVAATVHTEFAVAAQLAGYPRHDLDLVSNLVRCKLRLAHAVYSDSWTSPDLSGHYVDLLRSAGPAGERWHRYQYLCDLETQQFNGTSQPEILDRLARPSRYRPELGDLLAAEMSRYRLPYSEWERVVIETTLFFHAHLPAR